MSQSKWEKFHSTNSARVDKPAEAGAGTNIRLDWHRATKAMERIDQPVAFYIGDIPLTEVAKGYNNFSKDEDVENFFKEVLMQKIEKPFDEEKVIAFLKKFMHQGGLINPVSSALSVAMERDATPSELTAQAPYINKDNNRVAEATLGQTNVVVKFIPTKKGIRIQEKIEVKSMIVMENAFDKYGIPFREDEDLGMRIADNPIIMREDDEPVIKAQCEVNINCLKDEPKISVGHNLINYNDERIEKAMDKRNMFQIFSDFIKRSFGFSKVEVIEDKRHAAQEDPVDKNIISQKL